MEPMDDDFDDINSEQKSQKTNTFNYSLVSTSISLHGGDITLPWNQIGNLNDLNDKTDAIRSYREYFKTASIKNNDGGFDRQDDVLFFSKIDNQYIPGVIADKKKDKLTKDYVYKIKKIHKRDPEVDEELSGRKRSAKEDPRVEIIKLRQERAKKQSTISWNAKKPNESYYKIMSANDYQIELQISLLKILKLKVAKVIKKRNKANKLSRQATKIGKKMQISQQKRDRKQRVAQTFSGSRQQMVDMSRSSMKSKNALSPKQHVKRSKSRSNRTDKRSSKHGKHGMSVSSSDMSEEEEIIYVNKPSGNAVDWSDENVLNWLQWISQHECEFENDRKLSEEERKNFTQARKGLFVNYYEKFINADIAGKALEKLDNVTLRSKVYVNNAIDRKIMVKCLDDLFIERKTKTVSASKYVGTEYDFSKDWKKSNAAQLKWEKKKRAAGNISKMTLAEIGTNTHYKGTKWTQDIEESTSGGIYGYKASKHSKHESFQQRKKAMGSMQKQTVAEIGMAENYTIPEYAEKAIADTMMGQATDERSRWGGTNAGMDIDGDNRELLNILLHANVPIPPELTTPVKGYHTIQNRNAQLRNLLLKHQALLDDLDIANNPELARAKALQAARKKFEKEQEKREMDALKKGDLKQLSHKKMQQIKQAMKAQDMEEKRLKSGRKYKKRNQKNMSSLALMKKRKKKMQSSSLALTDIAEKYKKNNKQKYNKKNGKHSRKRSSSIDTSKHLDIYRNKNKNKKKNETPKRPLSANNINRRSATVVGFAENVKGTGGNSKKKLKSKNKRKVKFTKDKNKNKNKKVAKRVLGTISDEMESAPNTAPMTSVAVNSDLMLSPAVLELSYDASADTPMAVIDSNGNTTATVPLYEEVNTDNEYDILAGIERMHSTNAESMVIHSRVNSELAKDGLSQMGGSSGSLSFETSWVDTDHDTEHKQIDLDDDNESEESSEITFSDDDDENDDDENTDDNAVPLSIQRLRAQEKENEKIRNQPPLPKIMSQMSDD